MEVVFTLVIYHLALSKCWCQFWNPAKQKQLSSLFAPRHLVTLWLQLQIWHPQQILRVKFIVFMLIF